jgi:hypothetical protein
MHQTQEIIILISIRILSMAICNLKQLTIIFRQLTHHLTQHFMIKDYSCKAEVHLQEVENMFLTF